MATRTREACTWRRGALAWLAWGAAAVLLSGTAAAGAEQSAGGAAPGAEVASLAGPGAVGSVAVLPPRVDEPVATLRAGLEVWLRGRLGMAGFALVERSAVGAAAGAGAVQAASAADLAAWADRLGATRLAVSEIGFEAGRVDVRLRLHDALGTLLAGGHAEAPLAELGGALQQALEALLGGVGVSAAEARTAEPPALGELASLARAAERLAAGALADAWSGLHGLDTPAAAALRDEIARAAETAPVPERSRLASVRGVSDSDWLRVRQGLADGEDPEMLVAGAGAALAREDRDVALRLFEEALRRAPDHRVALRERARLLETAGRSEEARAGWQRLTALAPGDPEPLEALARLTPSRAERARHLLKAAELRAARLEAGAALAHTEAAARADAAALPAARRHAGLLQLRLGQPAEALLALEEAAATAPAGAAADADLLAGLGEARAAAGDADGAELAYREALSVRREHVGALQGMGHLLVERGRAAEAVPHLEQAVAVAPERPRARRLLARAQREAGQPDAALATLSYGGLGPADRARLLGDAADIHREAGRLEDAELTLREAVALDPHAPPLHDRLAQVLEDAGRADAADAERAAVVSLTGAAIEPTERLAGATGEAGRAAPRRAPEFAALFASFPAKSPETGLPLANVAFLGLVQQRSLRDHVLDWLSPTRPDLEALDRALVEGVLGRFLLAPPSEVLPEVVAGPLQRVVAFGTDREDVALVNDVLQVDGCFVARLTRSGRAGAYDPREERFAVEVRLLGGRRGDEVFILANELALPPGAYRAWNARPIVPLILLSVLVALPFVRGWGTVVVILDYETAKGSKGFFSIQLSTKPGRAKAVNAEGARDKSRVYQRRVRSWSRYARHMVERETRFRFIPARAYYVDVHGLLQDTGSGEVIGNYLEERRVQLGRGETVEVAFDFRPKEAALEVRLVRPPGEREPLQAQVAIRGRADSLRYVKDEATILHVPNGRHVVVVGYGDRVLEQEVAVAEFKPTSITLRLADEDQAVFTGCPAAVEPYLGGELAAAADALERAGHADAAGLVRARHHEERGEHEQAARLYQAAGRVEKAATLGAQTGDAGLSATLYEEAGDFGRAAERYAELGDLARAAAAYEAAYDYDNAIEAYREAGDTAKVMELLEKTGGYFEAARIAREGGDAERAIRDLQMVDLRDPDYGEACRSLAEIFAEREEWSLALQKVQEAVEVAGEEAAPLELHEQLGEALEHAGQLEDALACFEAIRKRDFSYPGVAERVSALREKVSAAQTLAASRAATVASPASPQEDRYELLEEIGRGGMGIVYKARDRRLERVVALKRLPDNLRDHPTAVQLFLREARAAAALNHPNIVTLFDADQHEGNYYITMEFLEGLPLDKVLRKYKRLSARDTLRLAVQISTGLQYAHERRIVHRDIKTSNLFFTREKVVKIMDFGLAKMMEEVRRAATVIGGTPYYMAPEQAAGDAVDHRADLYALGVTLYELLTGRVPFTEGDVTYHHRHTPPPDPRERVPDLPEPVVELVMRLIAKSPDDRFPHTADVTHALTLLTR